MKRLHTSLAVLMLSLCMAVADNVTVPHTFTPHTTAKASEVNANFSAVAGAVNDNADRVANAEQNLSIHANKISDLENSVTQNATDIAANISAIEGKIDEVVAGGGLQGGGDSGSVTLKLKSGSVSIPAVAFRSANETNCKLFRVTHYAYFLSASTMNYCYAYAPVFLPHGAKIKSLTCYLYNNDPGTLSVPTVSLTRVAQSGSGSAETLLHVAAVNDLPYATKKTDNEVLGGAPAEVVDNSTYSYYLSFLVTTAKTSGLQKRVYGCNITYEF